MIQKMPSQFLPLHLLLSASEGTTEVAAVAAEGWSWHHPRPNTSQKTISLYETHEKVTAREVEELVKGERNVPLVVDFYAPRCGPCILMAQDLEMLAVEYEKNARFVKVDTDNEYEFVRNMQIRGLPTLYFFSQDPSKDAIRTEGLIPSEMIKYIIDNEM